MSISIASLNIKKIVTDSDLDGVVTAAILKRYWEDAEVVFAHPGELRSGNLDNIIDNHTAICDLPRHHKCGLNIDHHHSNRPNIDLNFKGVDIWRDAPSAARIAYDLLSDIIDLSDLKELLLWVDKIDSGNITKEEFLSDGDMFTLSKLIGINSDINIQILNFIKSGVALKDIFSHKDIAFYLNEIKENRRKIKNLIKTNLMIVNRLAIVRFDESGVRSNGYDITAEAGDKCDACIVIHGKIKGDFDQVDGYPVSASFYTNSFLHKDGGIYDLTKLAKRFDKDGGGHPNACGCRIKPLEKGELINREVNSADIEKNLKVWIKMWNNK